MNDNSHGASPINETVEENISYLVANKKTILLIVVTAIISSFVSVLIASISGSFRPAIKDFQAGQVAEEIMEDKNLRAYLISNMANDDKFRGRDGKPGKSPTPEDVAKVLLDAVIESVNNRVKAELLTDIKNNFNENAIEKFWKEDVDGSCVPELIIDGIGKGKIAHAFTVNDKCRKYYIKWQ